MSKIAGLDLHSKSTVYFVQQPNGETVGSGSFPTSWEGFSQWVASLQLPRGTRVGLETGTQMTFAARILSSLGMEPVVIDAHEVRRLARRGNQKSDLRDAFEICDGLRRDLFRSRVYVPDEAVHRLRQVLSRRRHFVSLCTSQVNAAKFLLRTEGLASPATLTTEAAWRNLLADPRVSGVRGFLELHFRAWQLAAENVATLDKDLDAALASFTKTERLLRTVPGVGRIVAATFIATLGRPERFATSHQVGSYLGLVPSSYDSGEAVRRGHIVKAGSPALRAVLTEAAHHAARPTHPLNPYWRRIYAKGGYRKAVVAVAHRLARILFRMWRNEEAFCIERLNVLAEPVICTKTYAYRLKHEDRRRLG